MRATFELGMPSVALSWSKASLRKPLPTPYPSWRRLQEGKEAALKAATEDVADVRIVSRVSEPSARTPEADSTSGSVLCLGFLQPLPPLLVVARRYTVTFLISNADWMTHTTRSALNG